MRTLLPILLLSLLGYAAWYYWQVYTDEPLQEKLLLHAAEELRSITITAFGEEPFQLIRAAGTDGWTVKRGITEWYDQTEKVNRLLLMLETLRTDSVMRSFSDKGRAVLELESDDYTEHIELAFLDEALTLGRVVATGDVFALNPKTTAALPTLLRFGTYQNRRLLRIAPERIDSIVVQHQDSVLWRQDTGAITSLAQTFIAPAAAPQADYFDEIMDQEKYYATLYLYAQGTPHEIAVYQDSLWPKPFVLIGEDFPRQYWAMDSILLK